MCDGSTCDHMAASMTTSNRRRAIQGSRNRQKRTCPCKCASVLQIRKVGVQLCSGEAYISQLSSACSSGAGSSNGAAVSGRQPHTERSGGQCSTPAQRLPPRVSAATLPLSAPFSVRSTLGDLLQIGEGGEAWETGVSAGQRNTGQTRHNTVQAQQ